MASESLLTQFPYDNIALLWGATRYLCQETPPKSRTEAFAMTTEWIAIASFYCVPFAMTGLDIHGSCMSIIEKVRIKIGAIEEWVRLQEIP
ncbi:hypothetical protein PMG71_02560 [Roseofilum sp. BLCC_M154]|uniref:Uncharacterized protein n=1 Tax=Roseofilum acuticapitatum BLCC-M154 TaxID=3022444 RepID=A0ABT7AN24_9CYAN|nr:hypothetical protein [Roseofilum acuticapitatum]MDJ1168303.1 hypothetical protein [Roseofilum acuticapitatum BLCC-M154]